MDVSNPEKCSEYSVIKENMQKKKQFACMCTCVHNT